MSFKTFQNYNGDNVNKTIELIGERADRNRMSSKEVNTMDKILKDALNVRVNGVMWEPLPTKRWFNWKELRSYSDSEFKTMLEPLTEGLDYQVLKIGA